MKLLASFALALLCSAAQGQCLPRTIFPTETGTDYLFVETEFVEGRVGWCPVTNTPSSGSTWKQTVYQWRVKRFPPAPATLNPFVVLDQIRAASSPMAGASAAYAQFSIPLTDPVDLIRYRQWRFDACVRLITPPTLVDFGTFVFPADYCGTRPADPAPPAWKTVGGTIFTYSGSRLTGIVSGRKAPAGLTCDCEAFSAISGGRRYCKIATAEASECKAP